jgi:hypothetical protein
MGSLILIMSHGGSISKPLLKKFLVPERPRHVRAHGHSGEEVAAVPWPLIPVFISTIIPRALRPRKKRAAPGVIDRIPMAPRAWRTSCDYRKACHPRG